MADSRNIDSRFYALKGQECCSVIWGKGTGSVINISFGSMRKLKKPLSNPYLSERDRNFEADVSLMIWCAWRIRRKGGILVAWRDAGLESEHVYRRTEELLDKKVIDVTFDKQSGDVRFDFDGGYRLDIFCDVTNDEEGEENYILYTPQANFSVEMDGEVTVEEKEIRQ